MSSGLDKAIKDFIQIIREAGNKGTSPLDAQAEVLRIDEDGTAWVHLPGGVDETPVRLTINAEVGDKVHVRLSGGRAWITGNQTAPPTDDKTAIVAKRLANLAGNQANVAQKTADQAQIVADSALKSTKENAAQMAQMVLDFNGDIENLQDQIDGNIATWFYDVDPDMSLPPVTDWDTDEKKDAHLGDIYYNTVKGYAWRFMKSGSTYSWERITDTDVTKALADAAKAQDTADSKRRVFYNTPTVPYDAGDLWVQGSGGDILRCAQAKTSTGSYDINDWVLASKYTDNSALNTWIEGDFATTIKELEEGLVDAKIETYYQATDPSTGWSDTQKSEHKGDLWYNSTASVQKYYRWSGTAWQELTATPPQAVFDNIDKKATIYTGTTTPTNPDSGDLWFKGADEPILTYVNNSWVEYNKYTDDSAALAAQTSVSAVQKQINPLLTRVLIDNDSVDIVDLDGNVLASYGVEAIIGKNTEMQMVAGSSGIKFEKDGEYSFKLNPKDVITDVVTEGTPSEIYGSTGTDLAISGTAYKIVSVIGANGTDYTSSAVGHQRYPIVAIEGKTPSQISYPVTIKYFDGATFIDTPSAELIGQFEATDYLSTTKRIDISHCVTAVILTGSGGSLYFTIPLNRVLREDAVLKSISFNISVRASYADGEGKYIVKDSSGGTTPARFEYDPNGAYSASNPIMTFYDGANNKRTPYKKPTVQIEDGCMLYFEWVTGTKYYFAGNSTLSGKLNNNACTAYIDSIVIDVGYGY